MQECRESRHQRHNHPRKENYKSDLCFLQYLRPNLTSLTFLLEGLDVPTDVG